jgi:hypothetical protein
VDSVSPHPKTKQETRTIISFKRFVEGCKNVLLLLGKKNATPSYEIADGYTDVWKA